MKALQLIGKEKFKFAEVPKPEIKADEVLLKIKKVGICGTDLHIYHGGMKVPLPLIMGHEFVGDVAEVGLDVTNVKVGDRAVAEHVIGCGNCTFCNFGKCNLCIKPTVIGLHRPGALAEYVAIPARLVYRLPDELTYDDGVLVEPLSIAVYGIRRAGVGVGDNVVVVGQGTIGLFIDQVAKAAGASVCGIDVMQPRLDYASKKQLVDIALNSKNGDVAEKYKKETNYAGADVVFEVVGRDETIDLSLSIARPDGKVAVLGVFEHDASINMMDIVKKELHVLGSWTCLNSFEPTLHLLANKHILTDGLITHRYKFADTPKAFIDASSYSDNRIKSAIEF